jgi:hypothetical protein
MKRTLACAALVVLCIGLGQAPGQDKDGWISLFNGKDTAGWKLKSDKYTVTKFVDDKGAVIAGAKEAKLDQTLTAVDAQGKPVPGAKVVNVDGKDVVVVAAGTKVDKVKIVKSGGRLAIVDAKGKELPTAKKVQETLPNPTGGWKVENGVLTCGLGPKGVDLFTEQKFQDFQLHVEFQGTSNSGVYLQGRYEIQIDNSFNVKPKLVEKDGKKVEELPKTMCGALYGQIAPSKNMAKPAMEWQTFDITFRAPRGEKGKVTKKAHVTVVWNGEQVIDADIPNGTALDPGPVLLQGDHGKVSFRNIKIKPLSGN